MKIFREVISFMFNKILLPMDGSIQAEKAGEYALTSADSFGADIIVLYVVDTYYLNSKLSTLWVNPLPEPDLTRQSEKELRAEGKNAVESFKNKLEETQCGGKCKNVNIITMIKEGKPADVILETINEEGVDSVVMGKSSKHGIDKFLLGSTTEKVVKEAKIPVHVIP
jgi:nucleotide-binding universal stress UspA family protein